MSANPTSTSIESELVKYLLVELLKNGPALVAQINELLKKQTITTADIEQLISIRQRASYDDYVNGTAPVMPVKLNKE